MNNTPIVAVFIPLVTGLSERYGVSPSKLLLALSFAAMLGGTLTLVGTSTNPLASAPSRELLGRPFSMFTLTPVGVPVLLVGVAYLLTVGRALVPARLPPTADFTEEFDMDRYLAQLSVREPSPLVGLTVAEALDGDLPAGVAGVLSPLALLAVFYLLAAVVASASTPIATVVLLAPVAVATARGVGLNGFPFLLAVTFAVATAVLTPVGYQTNLVVYGPGGYRLTDYGRVGPPLQLLLCAVTTLSVAAL